MKKIFEISSLLVTQDLAKKLAPVIVPDLVLTLNGNLGAGKTTLTREILFAMGVTGRVKSPTFTLVEPYEVNNVEVYHFDLYRFDNPEEWLDAGFDEYFNSNSICFIEWAEKAENLIPQIDLVIDIEIISPESRKITITSQNNKGDACLNQLI